MNPPGSLLECPGWFGKIPSLGDFATRRLPPSFVEPWDEWLSAELSAARLVLADAWSATYAGAPIACFSLGAGTVDDHAWLGILVPSFDRVGRQFPLTLALQPRQATAAMQRHEWAALVAAANRALAPACGAAGVDEALAVFSAHRPEPVHCAASSAARVVPAPADPGAGTSAWWHWSAAQAADAVPDIVSGLPRGERFRRLLGAR